MIKSIKENEFFLEILWIRVVWYEIIGGVNKQTNHFHIQIAEKKVLVCVSLVGWRNEGDIYGSKEAAGYLLFDKSVHWKHEWNSMGDYVKLRWGIRAFVFLSPKLQTSISCV